MKTLRFSEYRDTERINEEASLSCLPGKKEARACRERQALGLSVIMISNRSPNGLIPMFLGGKP
jgi:hypothetical protein